MRAIGESMAQRRLLFVIALTAVSLLPARAEAQYEAPNYSIERWDEDYSYLKGPASPIDPFDGLKYIPLGGHDDWYLSLGGQARARFDYFNNAGFGKGKQSEQGFELVRLLANADLHFGPNLRAFIQLNSGLEYDRFGGARIGDVDDFDIQQAFVDVNFPLQDSKSMLLRVGRQESIYGAQRLISPNDWANVRRTFEGMKLSLSLPGDTLDVFVTQPVEIEKAHFNSGQRDTLFAGIYNVTALPGLLPSAGTRLDLYLLDLDRNRSSETPVDSAAYTLGVRLHSRPAPWDFDVEADWQFGATIPARFPRGRSPRRPATPLTAWGSRRGCRRAWTRHPARRTRPSASISSIRRSICSWATCICSAGRTSSMPTPASGCT